VAADSLVTPPAPGGPGKRVADPVKDDSVAALRCLGLDVVMITAGDARRTAEAVAR